MKMIYLKRGLAHLRRGTLPGLLKLHLQHRWQNYIQSKRDVWWKSQVSKREYIEKEVQPGVRMRLFFDTRLSELVYFGDYERPERQFLNAFLRSGDVFVDVGANIGLYTSIAAHLVGSLGHVYAFEPCSLAFQRLVSNVQLNCFTNVFCEKLALSDSASQLGMKVSLDGWDACNSLAWPIEGAAFGIETVGSVRWDDFADENGLVGHITMMKIDVEGWELHVLKGGYRVLSLPEAPVLQIEFADRTMHSAGSSCTELYRLLEKLGYQMFTYDMKSRRLIPDPIRVDYTYLNLIAAKRPDQVAERLNKVTAG